MNNINHIFSNLNQTLNEKYKPVKFEFVEYNKETRQGYGVDLILESIAFMDSTRCVFYGNLKIANQPLEKGYVECVFDVGSFDFWRISFSIKTERIKRLHNLILHNNEEVRPLLFFLLNEQYRLQRILESYG